VTGFYDRLRAQVGPRTPICAVGTSAGGQLALVQQAFGYDAQRLRANSPILRVSDMHGPALLAHETADPIVPVTDAVAFAAAYPDSTLVQLEPGNDEMHVHSMVSSAALSAYHAFERGWVDGAMRGWSAAHPAAAAPAPEPAVAPTTPAPAATDQRGSLKRRTARTKRRAKRERRRTA
jgi:hypothetical protein